MISKWKRIFQQPAVSWLTRQPLPNPRAEITDDGVFVAGLPSPLEKDEQIGRCDKRKSQAGGSNSVLSCDIEHVEGQYVPVQPPDFRDTQSNVNGHSVERTAANVHFNGQVGRWMAAQIESANPFHPVCVGNPKTGIRLGAALPESSAQRCRAAAFQRQTELFGEHEDEIAKKPHGVIVCQQRCHDL